MGRYRFAICLGIVVIGSWIIFSVTKDKDIFQKQDAFQVQREQDSITGEKKVIPLEEWEGGVITGVAGKNIYTDIIQKGPVYGEVEEFLTFETDTFGEKAAFVFAGKRERGCFSGSIWLVKEEENVVMLEQNVCIENLEIPYRDMDQRRFIFLNYTKGERNCGRVFLYQNSDWKEILKPILGRKIVDSNGVIQCMYLANDERCVIKTDEMTGETHYIWEGYTEKPYILYCYSDGGTRELSAYVITEEELLTYPYGKRIIQKTEEKYPQGIRQYIIRENGEVNVNIAKKEGNEISFFYMTFSSVNQEREPETGTGCYLLQMTGERSWQVFLDSFAKEAGFLPQDISILPWYFDRKRTDQEFTVKIDSKEEDGLKNKESVGMVFTPEGELLERLSGFVPDCSESWQEVYDSKEDGMSGSEEEREGYQRVKLLGKSDSFLLYVVNDDAMMILKTADNVYLCIEKDSILYHPYVQLYEKDWDKDGEVELLIWGKNGYYYDLSKVYMVDKDLDGEWKSYEISSDWYRGELENYCQLLSIDQTKTENITFEVKKDRIYLNAEYKDFFVSPPFYENEIEKDGVRLNVVYLGGGKWKVEDACYYSGALEEKIIYDIVLSIEIVKEIEEIQYDSILVQECKTTEGIVIPVVVKAVSMQGEEILITMDVSYQISEDKKEGRFFVENVEVIG